MIRGFKTRCENLSVQLRRQIGVPPFAPLSPRQLAEHMGMWLKEPGEIQGLSPEALDVLLRTRSNDWSAVTLTYDDLNLVIYNPSHSLARQSSDVMHELAHILLDHAASPPFVDPKTGIFLRDYNQEQEEEAGWLMGCLLLPRVALAHAMSNGVDDKEICQQYAVSPSLLEFRTRLTGVEAQLRRRTRTRA